MTEEWTAGGDGELALVGDSLTQGGDWGSWLPGERVRNFGVAGDTTDDVIARLWDVVEARPASIALLIGTNDLAWRRSVEHVVRNIETMLVTLRKELPETRILVQSVMPRGREFADQIRDINRHLWQFAPTVHAVHAARPACRACAPTWRSSRRCVQALSSPLASKESPGAIPAGIRRSCQGRSRSINRLTEGFPHGSRPINPASS